MLEEIPIDQLLEESLAIKSILAGRFGVTLETRLEDPHVSLFGDRGLLRVAINNLIDDAIKNGNRGRKVLIRQHTDTDGVVINVSRPEDDDCLRTPLGEKAVLSEPRPQGTNGSKGSQLGMSLARRIANLHGGRIGVCSTDGEGSTYTLHLPLRRCEEVLNPAS